MVGFDRVLGFDTGLVQAFGTGLVGFGNICKTLRGTDGTGQTGRDRRDRTDGTGRDRLTE